MYNTNGCQVINSEIIKRTYGVALYGPSTANNVVNANTITGCTNAIYNPGAVSTGNSYTSNNLSNSTSYAMYLVGEPPANLSTLDANTMTGCANGIGFTNVADFTISGWNLSQWGITNQALNISNATNITVDNINTSWTGSGTSGYGIYMYNASGCAVTNSNFSNRQNGVALTGTGSINTSITGNTIDGAVNGIYNPAAVGTGNVYDGNILTNNTGWSMYLNTAAPANTSGLDNNNFDGSTNGICLAYIDNATFSDIDLSQQTITGNPFYLVDCQNLTFTNCNFSWNGSGQSGHGIYLQNSSTSTYSNITIENRSYGFRVYGSGSTNNTFHTNLLKNNGNGIYLDNGPSGNTFYNNDLVSNTTQVRDLAPESNNYDNGSVGNYWSDWDGTTTPWPSANFDSYPLSTPVFPEPTPAVGTTITTPGTVIRFDSDMDCGAGFTGNALTIAADNVTVDGNGYKIICPDAVKAIEIRMFQNIDVKNLTIVGAGRTGVGVEFWGTMNSTMENVQVSGKNYGIYMRDNPADATNIVRRNTISDCVQGLLTNGKNIPGNTYDNNSFDDCGIAVNIGYDIAVNFANNNVITNCAWGIYFNNIKVPDGEPKKVFGPYTFVASTHQGPAFSLSSCENVIVEDFDASLISANRCLGINACNSIEIRRAKLNTSSTGPGPAGLHIVNSDNIIVTDCEIDNYENPSVYEGTGIYALSSHSMTFDNVTVKNAALAVHLYNNFADVGDQILFINSTISNSDKGLWVNGSTTLIAYDNNFINNTTQIYDYNPTDNVLYNTTTSTGNYWSDWDGTTVPWPYADYDMFPLSSPANSGGVVTDLNQIMQNVSSGSAESVNLNADGNIATEDFYNEGRIGVLGDVRVE